MADYGGSLQRRHARGFTLVEVLVAITLTVLIAPLAIEGVRVGMGTWERLTAQSDAWEQERVMQRVLRRQIAEALPLLVSHTEMDQQVMFSGNRSQIEFVARLPSNVAGGGVFVHKVHRVEDEGRSGLVLDYWPFDARESDAPTEGEVRRIVLSDSVGSIEFGFYGVRRVREKADWHDQWSSQQVLPKRISLRIGWEGGQKESWSEWQIPVYASVEAG